MTKIAVIGAGLSGLTVANSLKDYADIILFDKSRGVGGRSSTRRATPYFFDHGVQFFKVKTSAFSAFIQPMIKDNIIACWDARFVEIKGHEITQRRQWGRELPHYVGVPGMNAVAKYLSLGLEIRLNERVQGISKSNGKWRLINDQGEALGDYDWVISTVPAEQASDLLPSWLPFYAKVKTVAMKGCFSLMLGFEKALPLEFDAALVRNRNISWISVNSSKPGRSDMFCLLVHSTNDWADQHINDYPNEVLNYLCQETSEATGYDVSEADHKGIHGWRYANIKKQTGDAYAIDTTEHIGVCGDWFIQGRVEAAFTSGYQLAKKILEQLNQKAAV